MMVVVYPTLGPHVITVPQVPFVYKNTDNKLKCLQKMNFLAFIYINYNFLLAEHAAQHNPWSRSFPYIADFH